MVRGKEKILSQGCEIPLNAFQLFGVSSFMESHTAKAY